MTAIRRDSSCSPEADAGAALAGALPDELPLAPHPAASSARPHTTAMLQTIATPHRADLVVVRGFMSLACSRVTCVRASSPAGY
jgi:hypothetical protein